MFPHRPTRNRTRTRFPRVRGDVPPIDEGIATVLRFSPRARGCSGGFTHGEPFLEVFPAHAGMFLHSSFSRSNTRCFPAHAGMFRAGGKHPYRQRSFPRARGDVPIDDVLDRLQQGFSPRTRGCSVVATAPPVDVTVFPAHAGMFLCAGYTQTTPGGFPRARGDVPVNIHCEKAIFGFSPRTRGCSPHGKENNHVD